MGYVGMDVPLSGSLLSGEDQYVGITITCNKCCKRVRAECWERTEKEDTNCLTQSGKAVQRRRCLSRSYSMKNSPSRKR